MTKINAGKKRGSRVSFVAVKDKKYPTPISTTPEKAKIGLIFCGFCAVRLNCKIFTKFIFNKAIDETVFNTKKSKQKIEIVNTKASLAKYTSKVSIFMIFEIIIKKNFDKTTPIKIPVKIDPKKIIKFS